MQNSTKKNEESYDIHAIEWESAIPTNLSHKYLEKPAINELLPLDLKDKSILCIGVGSGEELELIIERGAKYVTAIDISNELLKLAKIKFPSVNFKKMDMMDLLFPDSIFDVIYSSLTFHYTNDWDKLLSGVYRIIKKQGILLFSVLKPEHPNPKNKTGNILQNERGIVLTEQKDILPGNVEILYYNHVNTDQLLESVTHAGFNIKKVVIPSMMIPNKNDIFDKDNYDRLNKQNTENPFFLVISALKE